MMNHNKKTVSFYAGLLGFLFSGTALCAGQAVTDSRLTVDVIVAGGSGLTQPTTMAFINSNQFFICEKATGKVKWYNTSGTLLGTPLDLPVNSSSERGLLGIALHPDFASNGFVYLYYSRAASDGGTWIENRVSRFTWNGAALTSETPIVTFPNDATQSNGPNHDGGIILFGPDGKLYGVTGELNRGRFSNPRIETNTGTTNAANVGGIFRLNDDGTIPSDNPFASHTLPAIQRLYAYGVRNSFGMAFDSQTNWLWETENGPNVYDEINLTFSGWNGGWLKIMGPDSRNATYAENGNTVYNAADLTVLPGSQYSDPEFSWLSPVAVTSIVFLNSPLYPCDLQGQAIVGDNNFGQLYLFPMNANRDGFVLSGALADLVADNATERNLLRIGTGWNVVTDLKIGPDHLLYVVDLAGGKVLRIRPIRPLGDMNGDNTLDNFDIDAFVLALLDPAAYAIQYPNVNPDITGDINCDGVLDFFDIDPFVALILD